MEMLAAGAMAPDFRLPALDGGTYSPRDLLANGAVVVGFFKPRWPVWEFKMALRVRMGARDALRFAAVSQDDEETTRRFHQRFGVSFLTLIDGPAPRYPASDAYGIAMVPSLFILETDGTVSKSFAGFSKKEIERLGARAGIPPFLPAERVPEWKAG